MNLGKMNVYIEICNACVYYSEYIRLFPCAARWKCEKSVLLSFRTPAHGYTAHTRRLSTSKRVFFMRYHICMGACLCVCVYIIQGNFKTSTLRLLTTTTPTSTAHIVNHNHHYNKFGKISTQAPSYALSSVRFFSSSYSLRLRTLRSRMASAVVLPSARFRGGGALVF